MSRRQRCNLNHGCISLLQYYFILFLWTNLSYSMRLHQKWGGRSSSINAYTIFLLITLGWVLFVPMHTVEALTLKLILHCSRQSSHYVGAEWNSEKLVSHANTRDLWVLLSAATLQRPVFLRWQGRMAHRRRHSSTTCGNANSSC